MTQVSKQVVGGFEIYETTFDLGETHRIDIAQPVSMEEIETVNFVIAGRFDFGNGKHTFEVGCQTYDYPDRFAQAGVSSLTALEAGSVIVCINPAPKGADFSHAKRYLKAGDAITVPGGHLLYLAQGSITANGRSIAGPKALYAKSVAISVAAVSDCIAAEVWR